MAHQPMGGCGVEVDIGTGRPRSVKTLEERQTGQRIQQEQAKIGALNLLADLQDSPGLSLVFHALEERLMELAAVDPQCLTLRKIIVGWRSTLNPFPVAADRMARHALGPLNILRKPQAAPE